MRKVVLVFGLIASLLFPVGKALAQRNEHGQRDINKRIEALRSRLEDFRQNKIEQIQDSEPPTAEIIEESLEKISVDLENRNDVAVVVLFKDADYAVAPVKSKVEKKLPKGNTVALSIHENNRQKEDLARNDRYNELRRRVYLATRRTQDSAAELQQLVAKR